MKRNLIIISIMVGFIIGVVALGYIVIKRTTSDEAVKNRLLSIVRDFGEAKIDHAHMDFLEGITIDNLAFTGTSKDVQGKSIRIPKIILKHDPQSLIKGQLNISNAIIIAPELTIEKPSDIWSLLDVMKANLSKAEMPVYIDALRYGIEIRDLKVHINEDKQTNSPEITLSGIDITFLPYAGSFKDIRIKGSINDEFLGNYSFTMKLRPEVPSLDIEVYAKNLELDEAFLARFPYIGKMLWDDYKPIGKINVSCIANFNNQDNQKKMDYAVNINLNGIKALYTDWPFLIHDLNGDIELNPKKLYLKGVVGYIKNGNHTSQAEFRGEFGLYGSQKTFMMTIPNLFVNEELLKNIPGVGEQVWLKARPTGLVDLTFQYNEGEHHQERCNFLVVDCKGLEINPADFPLPISYLNGQFKICNNIILFKNTSGFIRCGDQSIFTEMNGVYDTKSERKIFNLHIPNLFITKAFLKNLPNKEIGEKLLTSLNPRGKADVIANFQGFKEEKDNDYSIEINLKDCDITASKYQIPIWGIEGRLELNKKRLVSKHMSANCYGGKLEGHVLINRDTNPYRYEGELNLSRINIEELAHHIIQTQKLWSGLLSGRIKYQGRSTDIEDFSANGQFKVADGYLSDVPIVLSVFNFLSLSLPRKETFHSAQAEFMVRNGFIHVNSGKISSDTIELNGRGDISLNGDLRLNVVAGFDKSFFSEIPLVGKLFDFVVGGVRKQLTMVEVKGNFFKPEIHSVPFKPITRSIKNVFDLLPNDEHDIATGTEEKDKN